MNIWEQVCPRVVSSDGKQVLGATPSSVKVRVGQGSDFGGVGACWSGSRSRHSGSAAWHIAVFLKQCLPVP